MVPKAIKWCVRRDAIRTSIFRNVRRVRLKECQVFSSMRIFAVREFFEDEILGLLSHDDHVRKVRTRVQLPLLRRLRVGRREWLRVRKLQWDAGHVASDLSCLTERT